MNIDKILPKERQYNYLDTVEASLKDKGLTFLDLKNYIRCGSSKHGVPSPVLTKNSVKMLNYQNKSLSAYVGIELLSNAMCVPLTIKI